MRFTSFIRLFASALLLASCASSCGVSQAAAARAADLPAVHLCSPAPTGITGHHDLNMGELSVHVYDDGSSAPGDLQAACTQAAVVVLSNWERNLCADYAVAGAEGRLLGQPTTDPKCTSPVCLVTQTCAVRITHVPEFAFAKQP